MMMNIFLKIFTNCRQRYEKNLLRLQDAEGFDEKKQTCWVSQTRQVFVMMGDRKGTPQKGDRKRATARVAPTWLIPHHPRCILPFPIIYCQQVYAGGITAHVYLRGLTG